jgi:hypothetical protein
MKNVKVELVKMEIKAQMRGDRSRGLLSLQIIKTEKGVLLIKPASIIKRNIKTKHDIEISIRDIAEILRNLGGVSASRSLNNEKFRATFLSHKVVEDIKSV